MRTIQAGDTVRLLPQWQDPGDAALHWIALEDEDGGRVRIAPTNTGLTRFDSKSAALQHLRGAFVKSVERVTA